jgi:hypothetical protein
MVIANTFGSFALLVVFLLGGFILARRKSTTHNTYIKDCQRHFVLVLIGLF